MSLETQNLQVAILDAGAQYTKLIDKMIRSLLVESVILPLDTSVEELEKYGAIIISGGPDSVYSPTAPKYDERLFDLEKPILGICYGLQLMNYVGGGTIARKEIREDGQFVIQLKNDSVLFEGLQKEEKVLLTHGDSIDKVAPDYEVIAYSGEIVAAICNVEKNFYGVQFHPEVGRLSPCGRQIFENFLFKVAGLKPSFTMQNRQEEILAEIRQSVGDKKVIVLVSGGVDSSVCAALMIKALKSEQIEAFHIDTGLMRENESLLVKEALEKIGLKIHLVQAEKDFLNGETLVDNQQIGPLCQTVSPEEKRKIIGDTYIRVINREVGKIGLNFDQTILVQGTLRPDLIESASSTVSKTAETIKTHHNDTALVRQLREAGRVIEPLKDLHKDEVRQLGKDLGLPDELVWRQPFPGPGLGVRIICHKKSSTQNPQPNSQDVENQIQTAVLSTGIKCRILPVKTVGVQGDGRSYKNAVALFTDSPNWQELAKIAIEIPKKFHSINRVVYVFGDFAENDYNLTETLIDNNTLNILRQADFVVNEILIREKLTKIISQMPVILTPVDFAQTGKRSIVLRPILTDDFMTGVPALPASEIAVDMLYEMVAKIQEVEGISKIMYDLTPKPPGTTEWE